MKFRVRGSGDGVSEGSRGHLVHEEKVEEKVGHKAFHLIPYIALVRNWVRVKRKGRFV